MQWVSFKDSRKVEVQNSYRKEQINNRKEAASSDNGELCRSAMSGMKTSPSFISRLQHAHGLGWSDTERLWDICGPANISLRPYKQSNRITFWIGGFTILNIFMQNWGCITSCPHINLGNQPYDWDLIDQNWRWCQGKPDLSLMRSRASKPPFLGWEMLGAAFRAREASWAVLFIPCPAPPTLPYTLLLSALNCSLMLITKSASVNEQGEACEGQGCRETAGELHHHPNTSEVAAGSQALECPTASIRALPL